MGSKWCPRCGAEYRDGYAVCSDCNASLVDEPPPATAAQQLVDAVADLERLSPEALLDRARRLDLTENEQLALAAFAQDDPALAEILDGNPTLTPSASDLAQIARRRHRRWWRKLLSP